MKKKHLRERSLSLPDRPLSSTDRSPENAIGHVNRFVIDSPCDKDVLKRGDLLSFHKYYRGMRLKKFELPPITSYRLRKVEKRPEAPESISKSETATPKSVRDFKGSYVGLHSDLHLSGFHMTTLAKGRTPCRNFPRVLSPIERIQAERSSKEEKKNIPRETIGVRKNSPCTWTNAQKNAPCPCARNSSCQYIGALKYAPCPRSKNSQCPSTGAQKKCFCLCAKHSRRSSTGAQKNATCPCTQNSSCPSTGAQKNATCPCALSQTNMSFTGLQKNILSPCAGVQSNAPCSCTCVQKMAPNSCADVMINGESSSSAASSSLSQKSTWSATSVPADSIGWTSRNKKVAAASTTLADVLKVHGYNNIIKPSPKYFEQNGGIFSDTNAEILNAKVDEINKEWHTMLNTRLVDDLSYDVYARTDKTPD